MPNDLSDDEWRTLSDIADPENCQLHDGETIEALISRKLIFYENRCYQPTETGFEILAWYLDRRTG